MLLLFMPLQFRWQRKQSVNLVFFLRLFDNSLSIKNNYYDHNHALFDQFGEILNGDLSELDGMITNNVSLGNFWDSIGYSLLVNSTEAGQINIVKSILKHADKKIIDVLDIDRHPLVLACINDHLKVVRLLLEHGYDPARGNPR